MNAQGLALAAATPPSIRELELKAEAGRAANAKSLVHGLDLRSRAALSAAIAKFPQVCVE